MSDRVRPNVLVVEDDSLVRTFLRFALERGGMDVVEVGCGSDALRLAAGGVDAVLVDGLLPDMHGVTLANRLLDEAATAGLPICFLSGAVQARKRPSVAGFGCLVKPVRPDDLVAQIEVLLDWHRAGGSPPDERRTALRRLENGFLVGP